jgi:hypothetical protein
MLLITLQTHKQTKHKDKSHTASLGNNTENLLFLRYTPKGKHKENKNNRNIPIKSKVFPINIMNNNSNLIYSLFHFTL